MAHHKSAIKRIRRNERANERNSSYLSSVRTAVKKFKAAVASGTADASALNPLFVSAQKIVAKAAQKGVLHSNNASRTISRLAKLLSNAGKGEGATAVKAKSTSTRKAGTAAKKKAPAKKTSKK